MMTGGRPAPSFRPRVSLLWTEPMSDQPDTRGIEKVEACAHCGAENPPGLLLCLECGRDPISGRDLFTPPEIPVPGEPPAPGQVTTHQELSISVPDPAPIADPFPMPTLELARKPDRVKKDRPEIYERVVQGIEHLMKQIEPVLAVYPPEALIYEDPDACLKRGVTYRGSHTG